MLSFGRLNSMDETEEDILFYDFHGISEEGNFVDIVVDAVSGEILLAEEKYGYDEDGRGMWRELEPKD